MAHRDDLGAVVAGGGQDQVGPDHVLVEQLPADEAGGVGAELGEHGLGVGLHGRALVAPGARALHDQAAAAAASPSRSARACRVSRSVIGERQTLPVLTWRMRNAHVGAAVCRGRGLCHARVRGGQFGHLEVGYDLAQLLRARSRRRAAAPAPCR